MKMARPDQDLGVNKGIVMPSTVLIRFTGLRSLRKTPAEMKPYTGSECSQTAPRLIETQDLV